MKIGIIIAYEKSPYSGVVRPFINWGKELSKNKNFEVKYILFDNSQEIVNYLKNLKFNFVQFSNINELVKISESENYDFILTDDYIKRLKLIKKIKSDSTKVVYVQVLFGSHSFYPFKSGSLINSIIPKLIPFSFFRYYYNKLVKSNNILIANSFTTRSILFLLYGIEVDYIIYPPLDKNIFKKRICKKENKVLLYTGSYGGDTDINLIREICKILENKKIKTIVFGNKKIINKIEKEFNLQKLEKIPDDELSKIYSQCQLTICPQKWEQFGYVVAESIACGTPVLAFDYMGPKEIIENKKFGYLAKNEDDFLNYIKNIENIEGKLKLNLNFNFPDKKIFKKNIIGVLK